jgi:CrcB protein
MAGGGIGSVVRFAATEHIAPEATVPWGTLLVNVAGSLALGYLIGRSLARPLSTPRLAFVGVGVMGALTTFGGVMVQLLDLVEQGNPAIAIAYLTLSVVLGIGSALLALRTGAER